MTYPHALLDRVRLRHDRRLSDGTVTFLAITFLLALALLAS